jgi:hypothetical protein
MVAHNMKDALMSWTAQELEVVVSRCVADEYSLFLSAYKDYKGNPRVGITLTKRAANFGLEVQVKGDGQTVGEAFEKALCNFPANPVGAVWDSVRLAPPAVDGEFTELDVTTAQRGAL